MKKILILLILSMVITVMTGISYAEPSGFIDIRLNPPEEFKSGVMLNFTLEDGTNALYTINVENNGYNVQEKMPVGHHKLEFINIYDDLKGEYRIDSPKEVDIVANQGTMFQVDILKKKDIEKKSEEKDTKLEIKDNTKEQVVKKNVEEEIENKKNKKSFLGNPTLILMLILGVIFGVSKLKQALYKD